MKQQDTRHLQHERYHYHYGLLHRSELFLIEIMMFVLVLVSLLTFAYSFFWTPTTSQLVTMQYIDSFIALTLLIEFGGRLLLSRHRKHFLQYNWWYILAAIPLPVSIAALFRALRIAGFIKMLKIGIHLKLEGDLTERLEAEKDKYETS